MVVDERLDAFDELGDALQRHQDEADRKQKLDRPTYEPAGIRRRLVDAPGVHEPRPREIDEDQADREEKEKAADDVDPDAGPLGDRRIDEIDPHMLVDLERIGAAQQDRKST